ncbi:MAG: hypothetical protein M1840_008840 [Geoglossum simile]|nr:MAG: hypothetical protein M1840_008840 [Geoglossum simile]
MASSSEQWREIVAQYPIGDGLDRFRKRYFKFVAKAPSEPSFNDIAISATADQEAEILISNLFYSVLGLDAIRQLSSHCGSSHKFLFQDLASILSQSLYQISTESVGILLEHVIEQPDDEESMWNAVYKLFIPATPPRSKSISPTMIGDRFMQHCIDDKSAYYAKILVFVQSSGMGKSRLVDAFGESCPMINFILRENEGYPLGDGEILDFMCEKLPRRLSDTIFKSPSKSKSGDENHSAFDKRRTVAIWNYSVAVGLLKASFEAFNTWAENQNSTKMTLEDLAAIRHEEMAPLDPKEKISRDSDDEGKTTEGPSDEGSRHVESLKNTAEKLIDNLKKFRKGNTANPLLVVVFNKATNLFSNTSSDDIDTGRYVALNRVLSCLKKLPIWFFMLSTKSRVENLLPAEKVAAAAEVKGIDQWNNPSGHRPPPSFMSSQTDDCKRLRLFPPFVSFRLDVEDRKRMWEPKSREEELSKPMTGFLKAKHITMFGRPLWFAYNGPDKLHKHYVLAALSFRLSLDVCIENPVSLDLVRTAVNSHLRVVISIDQRTGILSTATPFEPVLALAAMRLLCQGNNWTASIKTLTGELLQQGLVAKDIKGELFARLVMILVSDQVQSDLISQEGIQASEEEDLAFEGGQAPEEENLASDENLISDEEYSVKPTFTVYDFLKSLL